MIVEEPYFMSNDDWYYFDEDKGRYMIKESAPLSAKESYKEFYKELDVNNAP